MNGQSISEKKKAAIAMAVNAYIQGGEAAAVASVASRMPAPQPVMMLPQIWVVPVQPYAVIAAINAAVNHVGSKNR